MNPNKTLTPAHIEQIKEALGQIKSTASMFAGKNLPHRAAGTIETWCDRIGRDLLPQPAQTSDMRKAFERWMIHVEKIPIGSKDPAIAELERGHWRVSQAAWDARGS